ncbi:hypothetical protein NC652_028247 [Populus alba x Populus x berolinensis]|nr:hypothetical protein NC652_028247 [Populus alba x Populus x berolinensis]
MKRFWMAIVPRIVPLLGFQVTIQLIIFP